VKTFFRFAPEEGYLETDTFSEEQLRQLLASTRSSRDKAISGLFIDIGIRVTELASLHLDDVDFDWRRIKVHAKGAKERFVFVGNRCRRLLWGYINTERPDVTSGRLFIKSQGQPLKARGVLEMMRRCGKRAGIRGGPLMPHPHNSLDRSSRDKSPSPLALHKALLRVEP
jgi:site-specific recombinase XerD